jgi:transcriptional regulator GlxA family with amidase domain
MAEASLLDGYKATIHWEDHDSFSSRYSGIDVVTDRFVIDRKRITSGGALPTLDLMLEIIRRRQNYAIALEVSRSFLYERDESVRDLLPSSANHFGALDSRMSRILRLMEENIGQPLPMKAVARAVGLSPRHMQTLFHRTFGVSPHMHYLALRLNTARRRIIETKEEFSTIGESTGFNSPSAFTRAYRAQFSESPSETRKRIG